MLMLTLEEAWGPLAQLFLPILCQELPSSDLPVCTTLVIFYKFLF